MEEKSVASFVFRIMINFEKKNPNYLVPHINYGGFTTTEKPTLLKLGL